MQRPLPFDDSRRLTGSNLYFEGVGAVLETAGKPSQAALEQWRARVLAACAQLGWPVPALVVRRHATGAALAFVAPVDQLYSATEVNEWAWLASQDMSIDDAPMAPGHASTGDDDTALATLARLARAEANPGLTALIHECAARGVTYLVDDDAFSIGEGHLGMTWHTHDLPQAVDVPWARLANVPVALVTGSNGKTTTVRLLAALAREHGWHTGHSCTDGVFVDNVAVDSGDFSGPGGARAVLRDARVEAAVLESARGGMLRRGLGVAHADVAIVTNISVDHFGEYGIHDLDGLASVKLIVARALSSEGTLVLNADDPLLVTHGAAFAGMARVAWFSLGGQGPTDGNRCWVANQRLFLRWHGETSDLGTVAAMPLSFGGHAPYNVANMAAAALAARAWGIPAPTIARLLGRFGRRHGDNPGRLQHWQLGNTHVLLDYAHNPEGLRGLLEVARGIGADRRLGIALGQAGNRETVDIQALAATAARYRPLHVALKDIEGMLRGRQAGEVAGIMRTVLTEAGIPAAAIVDCQDEAAAVDELLAWARDGDLLVLPIHGTQARAAVVARLDALAARGWRAGTTFA
jgi:UDP-N-acetylmuramyl tripeptide synthase